MTRFESDKNDNGPGRCVTLAGNCGTPDHRGQRHVWYQSDPAPDHACKKCSPPPDRRSSRSATTAPAGRAAPESAVDDADPVASGSNTQYQSTIERPDPTPRSPASAPEAPMGDSQYQLTADRPATAPQSSVSYLQYQGTDDRSDFALRPPATAPQVHLTSAYPAPGPGPSTTHHSYGSGPAVSRLAELARAAQTMGNSDDNILSRPADSPTDNDPDEYNDDATGSDDGGAPEPSDSDWSPPFKGKGKGKAKQGKL